MLLMKIKAKLYANLRKVINKSEEEPENNEDEEDLARIKE